MAESPQGGANSCWTISLRGGQLRASVSSYAAASITCDASSHLTPTVPLKSDAATKLLFIERDSVVDKYELIKWEPISGAPA
jgi:hypothetical protein